MVCLEDGDKPFGEKKILSHNAGSIDGETSMAIITELCADPEFHAALEAAGMTIAPTPSFRHIAQQRGGDIRTGGHAAPRYPRPGDWEI